MAILSARVSEIVDVDLEIHSTRYSRKSFDIPEPLNYFKTSKRNNSGKMSGGFGISKKSRAGLKYLHRV